MKDAPQLDSTLTCPSCGNMQLLRMPTDACLWFHECEQCRTVLRPKAGDCCVFCSFGSVPCRRCRRAAGNAAVAVDARRLPAAETFNGRPVLPTRHA